MDCSGYMEASGFAPHAHETKLIFSCWMRWTLIPQEGTRLARTWCQQDLSPTAYNAVLNLLQGTGRGRREQVHRSGAAGHIRLHEL